MFMAQCPALENEMDARLFLRTAAWILGGLLAASAQAQTDLAIGFPDKPIHVLVGFAAGGGTDVVARLVGHKLGEALGQSVLVDNKTGASGIIAADYVAKAKPDGYTLLMAPSAVFTTNPIMFAKLPYSPLRDFVPVSRAVVFPLFLVVNASQSIRSVQELVDHIKANPRQANYGGSAGIFQLALELFKTRTGTEVEYVPYKGTNESVAAVLAGDVLMIMADAGPVSGVLKSGKVRGLAVTARARVAAFPDIPTMTETGIPGMEIESWMGLFAPAGTPMPIVRKLQDQIQRIVRLADVAERMRALQLEPAGNTSEEFARLIASDLERWSALARASNIRPTN